jgi:hypothetical protein
VACSAGSDAHAEDRARRGEEARVGREDHPRAHHAGRLLREVLEVVEDDEHPLLAGDRAADVVDEHALVHAPPEGHAELGHHHAADRVDRGRVGEIAEPRAAAAVGREVVVVEPRVARRRPRLAHPAGREQRHEPRAVVEARLDRREIARAPDERRRALADALAGRARSFLRQRRGHERRSVHRFNARLTGVQPRSGLDYEPAAARAAAPRRPP